VKQNKTKQTITIESYTLDLELMLYYLQEEKSMGRHVLGNFA